MLVKIHGFQLENNLRNESEAVVEIIKAHGLYQNVIKNLEQKAHEAEEWKNRAQSRLDVKPGVKEKDIIAPGAKKNMNLKQKSEENISDSQKQGGKS